MTRRLVPLGLAAALGLGLWLAFGSTPIEQPTVDAPDNKPAASEVGLQSGRAPPANNSDAAPTPAPVPPPPAWDEPGRPPILRAQIAAKAGHWKEAVRWLDEALQTLSPGAIRNRTAALRTYLVMTRGTSAEGGEALATLLADAAGTMAKNRFTSAADAHGIGADHTIFSGPFVVARKKPGWLSTGNAFARLVLGVARDVDGAGVAHLRSDKAFLAFVQTYMRGAVRDAAKHPRPTRDLLAATDSFVRLNLRIHTAGPGPEERKAQRDAVVTFLRAYAPVDDPRVLAYGRFLFAAFPSWANESLR